VDINCRLPPTYDRWVTGPPSVPIETFFSFGSISGSRIARMNRLLPPVNSPRRLICMQAPSVTASFWMISAAKRSLGPPLCVFFLVGPRLLNMSAPHTTRPPPRKLNFLSAHPFFSSVHTLINFQEHSSVQSLSAWCVGPFSHVEVPISFFSTNRR